MYVNTQFTLMYNVYRYYSNTKKGSDTSLLDLKTK